MSTYAYRAEQIADELTTKHVTPQRLAQLTAELDEIETASKTLKAAQGWSGAASPRPYGGPP